MDFSILSTALLLFFILDPLGNIPLVLSLLKDMEKGRRQRIVIRECLIGLAILVLFLFGGETFLNVFHLETEAVRIAGGLIFLLIGLKMIFPPADGGSLFPADQEPLIVPIALPMIAGPSALATLLVLSHNHPDNQMGLLYALLLAWGVSTLILFVAPLLYRVLRKRGLIALERLMGMLLLILSVQMFIDGIRGVLG
ncbi:MAG: multiple antibiotic resistance protein [Neolewinella sp.]|jgi:multiple antibiotic resistance protein